MIGVGVGVWVVGLSSLVCFSPFGSLPLYVLFAVYEFVVPKLFCSYVLFICAVCCVMNLFCSYV